jgi:hypothetical protein
LVNPIPSFCPGMGAGSVQQPDSIEFYQVLTAVLPA